METFVKQNYETTKMESKFRAFVLGKYCFNVSVVENLVHFFMENSCNWFHDSSAVILQVFQGITERFCHFVGRLHCLYRILRLAVLENV